MTDPYQDEWIKRRREIDAGDLNKTNSIRDANIAALFAALDGDELSAVGERAQSELGREPSPEMLSTSDVHRFLLRVGLKTVAPEVFDEAREAYLEYLVEEEGDF